MTTGTLEQMLDEKAIVDLTIAYAWALDGNDYERLRDVFVPEAFAMLGKECHGIDEIIARVDAALTDLDQSQHIVSNHQVEVDGDSATCRCYFQAQHTYGGANFIVAGRYLDELRRTADGWRIVHRVLKPDWREGDPSVRRTG